MKHTSKLVVRSYECDSYGHVNNAVYLNYLEFGRMEYLHAINFDYKGIVAAGYCLYVTHIDIYYKVSAFLDDENQSEEEALPEREWLADELHRLTEAYEKLSKDYELYWIEVQ